MKNDLNIRCIMSKDSLPVTGTEQAVYVLVDIRAAGGGRPGGLPANVALVLDRSGSMDGMKMERLKEAVSGVIDRLTGRDRLSVTVFDDMVETIVPAGAVRDRDDLKAAVRRIIPRGGTQIADGLRAGLAEARKGAAADRITSILLFTDGRTWDDESACLSIADEAGKEGIAITSIGFGDDWNEQLLLGIAERSRGNSHWIEDPAAIARVFQQEVDRTQAVTATNLKVMMRPARGVQPVRVHATSPMISDLSGKAVRNGLVSADLGTLDGVKGQALLIEARVPAEKAGAFTVGQIEVVYDLPSEGVTGRSSTADLSITFTDDAAAAGRVNAEVMNLVERVSAFKLQTRALTEAEAGNIEAATKRLQSAATVLLDLGEDELAAAAQAEIASLRKTGSLTSAGTKKLEYGTRKLTQAMK